MTEATGWRLVTRGVLYAVGVVAAVWLIVQLQSLVFQVFLGLIMACAADPLVVRIQSLPRLRVRNHRLGRGPIVLTVFAVGGLAVLALTLAVASAVVDQLAQFSAHLAQQSSILHEQLRALATQHGLSGELAVGMVDQIRAGLERMLDVVGALLGVFGSFLTILFTSIIGIYLASDADRILGFVVSLMPSGSRAKIDATARLTGQRLGRWVLAQVVLATIISLLYAVGLWILGIPYVGLLSLIAFIGEFIPLVGPFISAIPAIFVAFTATTPAQGVATAIFCLIVEQLENDLIVPRVMSSATTVHPLAVFLAILAGGGLLGPIGALLAVPLATCVAVVLSSLRAAEGEVALATLSASGTPGHDPLAAECATHASSDSSHS